MLLEIGNGGLELRLLDPQGLHVAHARHVPRHCHQCDRVTTSGRRLEGRLNLAVVQQTSLAGLGIRCAVVSAGPQLGFLDHLRLVSKSTTVDCPAEPGKSEWAAARAGLLRDSVLLGCAQCCQNATDATR